jgi:hypothetical protein
VFWVVLLHLAGIRLPPEVIVIDEANGFVIFVTSNMLDVSIVPLVLVSISNLRLSTNLDVFVLNWLGNNLILGSDDGHFDCIGLSFDRDSFFHVIMGFLDAVKALDHMVCHTILLFDDGGDCLDKTDHSFVTMGVEFTIIAGFDVLEFIRAFFDGLLGYFWLNGILQIGEESQTILQLDSERLVVNGRPFARQMLRGAGYAILAEDCLNLELVHELHFPDVFFNEGKLVILANYLESIKIKSVNKLILKVAFNHFL